MSIAVMEEVTSLVVMTEAELDAVERVIERGQQTFVEVGNALSQIREGKGYRLRGYSTFEEYMQQRWGWKRDQGYKLMAAAEAAGNVLTLIQKPPTFSQGIELARLEPEQQRQIASQVDFASVTTRELREIVTEVKNPAHVSYNSGNNEWYTPAEYIEAAWRVMGRIDLDPASSDIANRTVGASKYYTAEDDGLVQLWQGCVWLNPPYAGELIGRFTEKLERHCKSGDVSEALVLVNNATETNWFQRLLTCASAVCFPKQRVRFIDPDGNPSGAPLQGQAILYLGDAPERFANEFAGFGTVLYGVTAGRNQE